MISLDKLQPLGSVLAIGEHRYVVIGHRIVRDGERVGPGYVVVPYPLGFVDADSLATVPASAVDEVVSAGLASEASDTYLESFGALVQESAGISYDEYQASERLLADFAREEASNA